MKSYDVVDFGAPLKLTEKPTPTPKGTEVLLRTLAAGVCHSDIHIWEGWYDLGGGKKLSVKDRGLVPPLTMGHEIVGEVVAVGPEASGVKIGDKRLAHPWIGCGDCAVCRRGEEQRTGDARGRPSDRLAVNSSHVLLVSPLQHLFLNTDAVLRRFSGGRVVLETTAFWVEEPGVGALRTQPLPEPGPDDVLVRTMWTGTGCCLPGTCMPPACSRRCRPTASRYRARPCA